MWVGVCIYFLFCVLVCVSVNALETHHVTRETRLTLCVCVWCVWGWGCGCGGGGGCVLVYLCTCVGACVQVEKEEQAKREAEEAQALAQQADQWSSVVPPTETQEDTAGNWDDVRSVGGRGEGVWKCLCAYCSSLVPRPTLREERAWYPLFAHAPDLNSKLVNFTSQLEADVTGNPMNIY